MMISFGSSFRGRTVVKVEVRVMLLTKIIFNKILTISIMLIRVASVKYRRGSQMR